MLYRQGMEIERLSRNSTELKPALPALEDRIEVRSAAPKRRLHEDAPGTEKPEAQPSVEVDLSEPGMRYEILNRSAR